MNFILTILIALIWINPSFAGSITLNFELRGNHCTITNRGDSAAYYPHLFQLGRDGQWITLKTELQQPQLTPGGTLTADLIESPVGSGGAGIEQLQTVMIRFFDQAGVSFGHLSVLRPPPATGPKIAARYASKRLRLDAPSAKDNIRATWILVPLEEGIAPIVKPLQFTYLQPPARRIAWDQKQPAVIDTGVTMPLATLVHETADGLSLQVVPRGSSGYEHRAGWLNMKVPFYAGALFCAFCGLFILFDHKRKPC